MTPALRGAVPAPAVRRIRPHTRAVVGLLALLALACAGQEQPPAPAGSPDTTLAVTAGDMYFEPTELATGAGIVEITLTNEGAAIHDVVLEEAGDHKVVEAGGGQTASGSVELEAGTYTFYCSVPGHRSAGMEGTLTVE